MIPLDAAPFWHWVWENHPERGTEGFRYIRDELASMAESHFSGVGSHLIGHLHRKVGGTNLTDNHYYRLHKYDDRIAEAIRAENWKVMRAQIIHAHCEAGTILEEIESG